MVSAPPTATSGRKNSSDSPQTPMEKLGDCYRDFLIIQSKGTLPDIINAYLNFFDLFSIEDLKNYKESLMSNLPMTLSRFIDLKAKLSEYLEGAKFQQSNICRRLLEVFYERNDFKLAQILLEIVAEKKIVLEDEHYNYVVRILIYFCLNREKQERNVNSLLIIQLAYEVIKLGNSNASPMLTRYMFLPQIIGQKEWAGALHTLIQGALFVKNDYFLNDCLLILSRHNYEKHSDIYSTVFKIGPIQGLVAKCLECLRNPKSVIAPDTVLYTLCYWPPTAKLDDFCAQVLPTIAGNHQLVMHCLEKMTPITDRTYINYVLTLLKRMDVSEDPTVRFRLISILVTVLKRHNPGFVEEWQKVIQSFPTSHGKHYIYVLLDDFLSKLSAQERLTREDREKVFVLLQFGLTIMDDRLIFSGKCLEFIQNLNIAIYIPRLLDLTKVFETKYRPLVYQARAQKELPESAPEYLTRFVCNPAAGLSVPNTTTFAEVYLCAVEANVDGFVEACHTQLSNLGIESRHQEAFVKMFAVSSPDKKDILLHALLKAYFKGDEYPRAAIKKIFQDIHHGKSLDLCDLTHVRVKELNLPQVTAFHLREIVALLPALQDLDLLGCDLADDCWSVLKTIKVHRLSLPSRARAVTEAFSDNIRELHVSGDFLYNQAIAPLCLHTLEFSNFRASDSKFFAGLFPADYSASNLTKNVRVLKLVNPAAPFEHNSAIQMLRFPYVTSITLENLSFCNDTVRAFYRSFKMLTEFIFIGQLKKTGSSYDTLTLEPFIELLKELKNQISSFTFIDPTAYLTMDFLDALKGTSLESLTLSGHVTDIMVQRIVDDNGEMTSLNLANNPISTASVHAIGRLRNLQRLNVAGTELKPEDIMELVTMLPQLRIITIGLKPPIDAGMDNRKLARLLSTKGLIVTIEEPSFVREKGQVIVTP